MLESVKQINSLHGNQLRNVEWIFTILFTIEYIGRIYSSPKPLKYIFSFMGLIDFLSIIPTYLSLVVDGAQALLIIRMIRLIRIFRILNLSRFMRGVNLLREALYESRYKITVFFGSVLIIVIVVGTLMYLIEQGENGFDNIPRSIYWAIVTITTVGYGDISPVTVLGQTIASLLMIVGYAIIAVPTGIVTSQIMNADKSKLLEKCFKCNTPIQDVDANFCFHCGEQLN
jgi:voltage-gated potassium channel